MKKAKSAIVVLPSDVYEQLAHKKKIIKVETGALLPIPHIVVDQLRKFYELQEAIGWLQFEVKDEELSQKMFDALLNAR